MSADEWLTENGIDPDSVSQKVVSEIYRHRLRRGWISVECSFNTPGVPLADGLTHIMARFCERRRVA